MDCSDILTFRCPQFVPKQHTNQTNVEPSIAHCEHNQKETFVMLDDKAYFSAKYVESTPNWPSTCTGEGCTAVFGGDYKVGINRPVYCCSNAKNKHHPCVHAYCKPCYDKWQTAATGSTPRKKRRTKHADGSY